MSDELLVVEDLSREFLRGATVIEILREVSFTIKKGQYVSIVGASGAGKTTLLHLMGTLLGPTSGRILFEGRDVFRGSKSELARFRNERLGFVFQFHYLLPEFTAIENVEIPLMIRRASRRKTRACALELLERVGLEHRGEHRPTELSFGEQQRVAVARALVGEPDIILADEPTGNLDQETGERVFSLLLDLTVKKGKTLVVVTHNNELTDCADQVLRLAAGVCMPE